MDIFPFFRLLRSPVYLWIALGISPLLIFVPTWNVSSDSFVDLIYMFWLVAFIGFWGYAIGNLVGENQHRMFTWSLPAFRKRLMAWAASIGLLSVSAWTALLMSAPWNVAWPVVFCVNLGIYSCSMYGESREKAGVSQYPTPLPSCIFGRARGIA